MVLLGSPHRGDSSEYTQYTICNTKMKIILDYPNLICMGWDFFLGAQKQVRNSVVNEPSVFEPLKFQCICAYETVSINIL